MTDVSGRILDKYKLDRLIGSGGMGTVYEARHTLVGKRCAVKLLHQEYSDDHEMVKRMLREAQAAAAIGHPNIVDIYDFGTATDGSCYMVMEYLEGRSLAKVISDYGRLSPAPFLALVVQILSALEAAHETGIVHRDLKPENVFIAATRRGEEVKLLDFGISKFTESWSGNLQLTRTGTVLGTPYYMSPEQASGVKNVDGRTDLWAVGVILYQGLSETLPYRGENYNQVIARILMREPKSIQSLCPNLPEAVASVIKKALEKDPDKRYQTAREMREAVLGSEPTLARVSGSTERRSKFGIRPATQTRIAAMPSPAQRTLGKDAVSSAEPSEPTADQDRRALDETPPPSQPSGADPTTSLISSTDPPPPHQTEMEPATVAHRESTPGAEQRSRSGPVSVKQTLYYSDSGKFGIDSTSGSHPPAVLEIGLPSEPRQVDTPARGSASSDPQTMTPVQMLGRESAIFRSRHATKYLTGAGVVTLVVAIALAVVIGFSGDDSGEKSTFSTLFGGPSAMKGSKPVGVDRADATVPIDSQQVVSMSRTSMTTQLVTPKKHPVHDTTTGSGLTAAGDAGVARSMEVMAAPRPRTIQLLALPPKAIVRLDGKQVRPPLRLPADGKRHTLEVTAPGFKKYTHEFKVTSQLSQLKIKMTRKRWRPRTYRRTRRYIRRRRPNTGSKRRGPRLTMSGVVPNPYDD